MPTRCLSSMAWFVLLALVLSGCPKRPADPAELLAETAEPATLELLRAAGDQALLVALVRPSAWVEGARALAGLLPGLPEAERILAQPDLWAAAGALAELTLGTRPAGLSGALPGWDASRPLALALFAPSVDDSVLAARALMLEAAALGTTGLRHRVLIPATDSRALLGGLLEALAPLGLQADPEARALPGLRGGQVLRLPGEEASLLALVPEARWVRVEILQADTRAFASPEARLKAVEALLAPAPTSSWPLTPALLFAASRQDLLTLWLRPWWLRDLGGQVGTSKVAQAVRFADPSYRAMLLAAGLSEVSQGALVMDPRGAEVDDWVWSLGVAPAAPGKAGSKEPGPSLRMASVLSLTEQGARVWARGLESGALLPAAELPQASLSMWMRLDLAAAVAAAELPPGLADAKDLEELARRVQECGGFCMLHLGLRAPFGLVKALWRFLPAELPIPLPRGLGLAVGPLPAGLATAPALVAMASLPVGVNLAALEQAVGELRKSVAPQGLGILWRTEVRPEDTRVFFGLNESAERVFRGPEPAAGQKLLGEVSMDLRGLADGLQREAPEAAAVLARLGSLRGWIRLHGRWLQGEVVLGPPVEGAAPAWDAEGVVWGWESPGARAAAGRGAVCLAEVTRSMTEGFRALAYVDPSQKGVMLARAMEEASRHLPCALAEADTQAEARRLQRSLFLAVADLYAGELREDSLAQALEAGCKQGVQEACERFEALGKRPRLALARVEQRCGQALQGLQLARLPSAGAAELPAGQGPFGLAADRKVSVGAALEVLKALAGRGAREVVLAVDGPDGSQGVNVELAAGLAPAGAAPPAAAPGPVLVGIDGRPVPVAESFWKPSEPTRFRDLEAEAQGLRPDDCGLVKLGPLGRLEVVGGGESASPAPVSVCPEDRPCVDVAFALEQLDRAGLKDAPVYLDPAPDTPWEDVAALAAALSCQERSRQRKVILGPTDQARRDRAFGSGLLQPRGAGVLRILGGSGGSDGSISDVLGAVDGVGIGGLGCKDCLTGRGLGSGRLRKDGKDRPVVQAGGPILTGPMSKEVIRRVIKQHQAQVRYCYEKELLRVPTLAGKLSVRFVIGPEGQVTKADVVDEGLKSPAVSACVQKVIQRMKFPAPKGGGVVMVTYPFTFKSAE